MSDVTVVKVWPCASKAIDWSHDGIIALAAEESVELLVGVTTTFPNKDNNDSEQKDISWQHVSLQVPWFTTEELPDKEPAPIATYSIGEEISTSVPISVAWSPPGLAKHRRCALGALTSSLVLSIWASEGDPYEQGSWRRRLIVNDALAEYFVSADDDHEAAAEESVLVTQNAEEARLRTRVRAFTWAFGLPNAEPFGTVGTQLKWGQYIVALANDDNQILFVIIESPTSTYRVEEEWTADVLNHFTVTPDSESIFTAPNVFDDIMKQQRHISQIAWSPWTTRGEWYHSVLVYATNDDVRGRLITYKHDTIGIGDEIVYPNICLRHKGPMIWSPRVQDHDRIELALFGTNGLTVLTISATYATILDRKEHDLDDRWDDMSGAVWDQSDKDISRLHFSSITTTMTSPTAAIELSTNKLSVLPLPNWHEQISDTQALFSAQNDLKGNVKSKVWGLCGSPLGDFVAACHTVHPSDMLEYGPPKDRHCTVAVNNFKSYGQAAEVEFPMSNVTAEDIAFTLRKWLENTVEATDQVATFQEQVLSKMMRAYAPMELAPRSDKTPESYTSNKLLELTTEFKRNVFMNPNTLKDRYTILINAICSPRTPNPLLKALIAYRLATAITSIPPSFSKINPFSAEILSSHQQLVTLVNNVMDPQYTVATPATTLNKSAGMVFDTCDFCEAIIPMEDLDLARCGNGHEFPRCGLSFLAIQAPRITKCCAVCGTSVLNEEFVNAQEEEGSRSRLPSQQGGNREVKSRGDSRAIVMEVRRQAQTQNRNDAEDLVESTEMHSMETRDNGDINDDGGEVQVSLARLLFSGCDACLYCGGKYAG